MSKVSFRSCGNGVFHIKRTGKIVGTIIMKGQRGDNQWEVEFDGWNDTFSSANKAKAAVMQRIGQRGPARPPGVKFGGDVGMVR